MISKNIILTVGLLAVTVPNFASAQALKGVKEPTNLPPADYKGVQFVDYDGCIFVRAGRLGNINWVPRIDQTRKHMCSKTYASTFPLPGDEQSAKPAEPTVVASLDRGKVAYKGDVVKPVGAPDTSLVKTKEATPSAAQKAKAAAAKAAKAETEARLAAQTQAAEKLRQDAIAKKQAADEKKAEELAAAMKAAEDAANADEEIKQQIALKIAQDKEARAAKRTADKKARADALAKKKADAKAARLAKIAKRDAARELAAQERADAKLALAEKKAADKAAAEKQAAAKKAAAVAKKTAAKPIVVEEAKGTKPKPIKALKETATPLAKKASDRAAEAKKAAAMAAKKQRADELAAAKAAKIAAKAKAEAEKETAFRSGYYVDLGTTLSAARAEAVVARLSASGYGVETRKSDKGVNVFAGPFRTSSNARVGFYQVTNEGFKGAKIVKK